MILFTKIRQKKIINWVWRVSSMGLFLLFPCMSWDYFRAGFLFSFRFCWAWNQSICLSLLLFLKDALISLFALLNRSRPQSQFLFMFSLLCKLKSLTLFITFCEYWFFQMGIKYFMLLLHGFFQNIICWFAIFWFVFTNETSRKWCQQSHRCFLLN